MAILGFPSDDECRTIIFPLSCAPLDCWILCHAAAAGSPAGQRGNVCGLCTVDHARNRPVLEAFITRFPCRCDSCSLRSCCWAPSMPAHAAHVHAAPVAIMVARCQPGRHMPRQARGCAPDRLCGAFGFELKASRMCRSRHAPRRGAHADGVRAPAPKDCREHHGNVKLAACTLLLSCVALRLVPSTGSYRAHAALAPEQGDRRKQGRNYRETREHGAVQLCQGPHWLFDDH